MQPSFADEPKSLAARQNRTYFARLPYRDGIARQLARLRGNESARYYDMQERKGAKAEGKLESSFASPSLC